jgi:putative inorganic carbon (hco3(-)) transporter
MATLAAHTSLSLIRWLRYHIVEKRLNTPVGYAMMGLAAIAIAYLSVFVSYKLVLGIAAIFLFSVIGVCCVLYPYFGYYTTITVSSMIFSPERLIGLALPFGFAIEILTYLTLLGALTQSYARQEIDRKFWRHPVTVCMIIFLMFFTLQAVNPSLQSRLGWFNYYRKFISFFAFYFLTYCLLNSKEKIQFFLKYWVIHIAFLALYACKQQWLGFFGWELNWIFSDEKRVELLYQQGLMRKFSLLSDPAASGVLFSAFMVFTRLYWPSALPIKCTSGGCMVFPWSLSLHSAIQAHERAT